MKAPKIKRNSDRTRLIDKNRLHARVFKYSTSKADERFFKAGIAEWIPRPALEKPTWMQLLFNMVHKRNNDGQTLKYCFFNDRHQRVFLDRDFQKWAEQTRTEQTALLKKIHG
jgi:hypothetical protein